MPNLSKPVWPDPDAHETKHHIEMFKRMITRAIRISNDQRLLAVYQSLDGDDDPQDLVMRMIDAEFSKRHPDWFLSTLDPTHGDPRDTSIREPRIIREPPVYDLLSLLDFIKSPTSWPHWPWLPVVRDNHTALVSQDANMQYFIARGANLFANTNSLDWQKITPEQIIEEGWRVD